MPVPFINKVLGNDKTIFYAWFESMYTRIDIALCNRPEGVCEKVIDLIYNELQDIEKTVNRFDPGSELYLLNESASVCPVIVSSGLFRIIKDCIDYYEKTSGCFDITVNSLDSYRDGIQGIVCKDLNNSIFYENPAIKIDLGGYAKGYALDKCVGILRENGITDALVNFGNSSVFALGNHPSGNGWKITLPSADTGQDSFVILQDECLSTSGNEEKKLHIRSPFDGQCIEAFKPVSVVTKDASSGEVFSTASFVSQATGREFFINFATIKYQ